MIFHDATLAAIAQRAPASLGDLQGISGIGARKLEAYGDEVLRSLRSERGNLFNSAGDRVGQCA